MLDYDLMTGEECILSRESDWPDGFSTWFCVELEATLIEELGKPLPMAERVADFEGKRGTRQQLFFEPRS